MKSIIKSDKNETERWKIRTENGIKEKGGQFAELETFDCVKYDGFC